MAKKNKMNFCIMREDEFICSSYEHRRILCKHSDGYICSFFNNENACCESKRANKEAAETAVRLGQEYLVRLEIEDDDHISTEAWPKIIKEAAEDWRKMMTCPDNPRVEEKDGKRFAVFPIRVEIPDDVSVVAVAVDMCGYPCIYRSDPHFDGIEWISGSISRGRVSIKNAADMIVKVPK
jgi:hypothetical protein